MSPAPQVLVPLPLLSCVCSFAPYRLSPFFHLCSAPSPFTPLPLAPTNPHKKGPVPLSRLAFFPLFSTSLLPQPPPSGAFSLPVLHTQKTPRMARLVVPSLWLLSLSSSCPLSRYTAYSSPTLSFTPLLPPSSRAIQCARVRLCRGSFVSSACPLERLARKRHSTVYQLKSWRVRSPRQLYALDGVEEFAPRLRPRRAVDEADDGLGALVRAHGEAVWNARLAHVVVAHVGRDEAGMQDVGVDPVLLAMINRDTRDGRVERRFRDAVRVWRVGNRERDRAE